ncbi:MAG: signal recognition particle protein [Solirubrobacteraceae bacterium]|nr:signal recognition particle protein [Patulibacter sp.]
MFDALSDRLSATLDGVRQRGTLTEADIDTAMRDVRLALLEADVNLKVVRRFTNTVKERALGADIVGSLNPGQQVIGIVHDELVQLLGGEAAPITFANKPPTVILLAGLQGSGKTTAAAKLAHLLKTEFDSTVALAACDIYRPAAIDQLVTMGERAGATVYQRGTDVDAVTIARWALEEATKSGKDVLIVDTAGRLSIDEALMSELRAISAAVKPDNTMLVVDAMTGQDAVTVAENFGAAVDLDGVVITKLDGDSRGGAALSVKSITGKPIMFASTGEKIPDFEPFNPEQMAQRLLGMGDITELVRRAQQQVEEAEAADMERKMRKGDLDFNDFLKQIKMMRRMGSLSSLIGMIPGVGKQLKNVNVDDSQVDRLEAIILSMTPAERRDPKLINGSRKRRIAAGSGTTIQEVGKLINQFEQMRKVMKQMSRGKGPDLAALMQQAGRR